MNKSTVADQKSIVKFTDALAKFDIQEQVIQDLEEATRLEITDTKSEKVVRKHRQNAKALEVKINKTRLKLNREYKEKTDEAASLMSKRVTAAYNTLDKKVKVVERVRAEKKAEKERAEKLRAGKIQWLMDGLWADCEAGLEYNLSSDEIQRCLDVLLSTEISEVDYQEFTKEAEDVLKLRIEATQTALKNRKKFEAYQVRLAEEKVKTEAEAKRLAEQQKAMEERQRIQDWFNGQQQETADCINANDIILYNTYLRSLESAPPSNLGDRQQEAEEYISAVIISVTEKRDKLIKEQEAAEAEAEILRQKEEALKAKREAFEKEKAEAAHAAIVAEREAFWEIAHQENFDRDHTAAIAYHAVFLEKQQAEIDQLRADAKDRWGATEKARAEALEREKLLEPDRRHIKSIATDLDKLITNYGTPILNTSEANSLVIDLISRLKSAIDCFERDGAALK